MKLEDMRLFLFWGKEGEGEIHKGKRGTIKEGYRDSAQYCLVLLGKQINEGNDHCVGLSTSPWAAGLALGSLPIIGNFLPILTSNLGAQPKLSSVLGLGTTLKTVDFFFFSHIKDSGIEDLSLLHVIPSENMMLHVANT